MQALFETVFSFICEGVLWSVGAFIKKLMGRPISQSGMNEQTIGLAVILGPFLLLLWWAHSV